MKGWDGKVSVWGKVGKGCVPREDEKEKERKDGTKNLERKKVLVKLVFVGKEVIG